MSQLEMLEVEPKPAKQAKKPVKSMAEAKPAATKVVETKPMEKSMPHNLEALLKQQEELAKEIERIRSESKLSALSKLDTIMHEYGLTPADVAAHLGMKAPSITGEKKSRKSPKPKYFDPVSNTYWSGRGRPKKAFADIISSGGDLKKFLIDA